jgi:hypothetical protein
MMGTRSRNPPGDDLPLFGDEFLEQIRVFVINFRDFFGTKTADFLFEKTLFRAAVIFFARRFSRKQLLTSP